MDKNYGDIRNRSRTRSRTSQLRHERFRLRSRDSSIAIGYNYVWMAKRDHENWTQAVSRVSRRCRTAGRGGRGSLHSSTGHSAAGRGDSAAALGAAATPSSADAPIPTRLHPTTRFRKPCGVVVDKPFTGDFDEMVKRRAIRVAVTFNRTHYFIDKGQERGITYEALKSFENDLNTDLKTGNLKVHVVIVPMSRDQLYPALSTGKVDMVAAMVTVRPELEKLVAFSEPTRTNVSQVVVTGPGAPPIATVDDLAGQEVFVRKASAYHETSPA